ncbi:MraY family glycosyltransferase [Paracoccus sp. (in: a-proteobacteria)]
MAHGFVLAVAVAAVLALGINAVAIKSLDWTSSCARRNDLDAVQAAHCRPTARVGGIGVFAGFGAAVLLLGYFANEILPILLLLSALPVFIAGILEDLGRHIRPLGRLLAAMVSATFAAMLTGSWVNATGLDGLDSLLTILPVSLALTVLWSAGLCNAFNLVDGVNGLAGFLAASIAAALGYVAWSAGDFFMAQIAGILAAAIAGFLVFNWPFGRIFLGDAGAYSIGHLLVWISVLIAWRNPGVCYAAVSLMFFWPVADTFLAIWRRSRRNKKMMHADYLHAHQFIMRAMQIRWKMPLAKANSATTVVLAPFFLAPIFTAVSLIDRPVFALGAWIAFGALFVAAYLIGIKQVRRRAWRGSSPIRVAQAQLGNPGKARRQ